MVTVTAVLFSNNAGAQKSLNDDGSQDVRTDCGRSGAALQHTVEIGIWIEDAVVRQRGGYWRSFAWSGTAVVMEMRWVINKKHDPARRLVHREPAMISLQGGRGLRNTVSSHV
jgi:hypothetical protein